MKIRFPSKFLKQGGGALLIVLFLAVLIGIPLLAYLPAVQTQHRSVVRSQNWNSVIPVTEAGIEEALAHLNLHCYSNSANNGIVKFASDGWKTNSVGIFAPRRYLDSSSNTWYDVRIVTNSTTASAKRPEIVCVAQTPALFAKGHAPIFAQVNQTKTISYIARQVRVPTELKSKTALAVGAKFNIKGNGQFEVDAYDAFDPNVTQHTGGYYDPNYRLDDAAIGSIGGDIDLGAQGNVYGEAYVAPKEKIQNGVIGSIDWIEDHEGQKGSFEPGSTHYDLNDTMPPVDLPPQFQFAPSLTYNNPGKEISYTNLALQQTDITSTEYPNPPPASGVKTNFGLIQWTTNLPPAGALNVQTTNNTTTVDDFADVPQNVVVTTNPPAWQTNKYDPSNLNQGPLYPADYQSPPGVLIDVVDSGAVKWPTNSGPPSGTYYGNYTNLTQVFPANSAYNADWEWSGTGPNKVKVWYNYYRYARISAYRFTTGKETFSWTQTYYRWEAPYYTYVGKREEPEVITDTYKYSPTSGYFRNDGNLSLSGNDKMLITGDTKIYIDGTFSMSGNAQIVITPGAKLKLYFGGDADIGGNGVVNKNIDANSFQMWGLDSCTDVSVHGNGGFIGTLYAPNADLTMGGGGSDDMDIMGSIQGKTVTANGHFKVHWPVHLGSTGPSDGFVAAGWFEEPVGTTP